MGLEAVDAGGKGCMLTSPFAPCTITLCQYVVHLTATTEKQYQGCKLLQLLMAWLELQLAKVCLLSTAVASMSQG